MAFNPLDLITSGLGKLAGGAAKVIDELKTDDVEKMEAHAKLEAVFQAGEAAMLAHASTIAEMQRDVTVAELQHGDAYTKRARPTLVYAGLVLLAINHMILPWFAHFRGIVVPSIDFPPEFWVGWSGVVGAWAIGRSVERVKNGNGKKPGRVTSLITGSSPV